MRHIVLSRVCVKYIGQKNSTNKNIDKKMEFLIINLFYEVLCPNPVQGFSNAPFTRLISIIREETKSNLSFKFPNVLILRVYDAQNLWINIVYSIYNNRRA